MEILSRPCWSLLVAACKGVASHILWQLPDSNQIKRTLLAASTLIYTKANNMVEQTRQPSRVVSLQAGPGEVDTDALFDVSLRINNRSAQAFGRQLAVIGDQLDREWTGRQPNWLPNPLRMLRPAQALTRTIYRDIHSQLWGFQGQSAAVKAWIASTVPGQGILRADAWATWVSSLKPVTCTGWTRGALATVALVAAVTMLGALWVEWKA